MQRGPAVAHSCDLIGKEVASHVVEERSRHITASANEDGAWDRGGDGF